jgi:hypothetical protein
MFYNLILAEGEYFSDEEDNTNVDTKRKKMRLSRETDEDQQESTSNLDDDSTQAIEAMLELSKNFIPPQPQQPQQQREVDDSILYRSQSQLDSGSSAVQTIHDDLEVSDSENEGDARNSDPDDGGLWF